MAKRRRQDKDMEITAVCAYCLKPNHITPDRQNRRYTHYREDFDGLQDLEQHLKDAGYTDQHIPSILAWKVTDRELVNRYEVISKDLPPEVQERAPL